MLRRRWPYTLTMLLASLFGTCRSIEGQNRVRLPADLPPSLTIPPSGVYPPGGTPGWSTAPGLPNATLGAPVAPFDPYAAPLPGTQPYAWPPAVSPAPAPGAVFGSGPTYNPTPTAPWNFPPPSLPPPGSSYPGVAPGWSPVPGAAAPSTLPPSFNPAPPPPYSPGALPPPYGSPTTPIQPAPLFPNGLFNSSGAPSDTLFQETGGIYTYLYGKEGDQLQIHEVEIFSTLVLKYFANNPYGFRITPGFAFDFLDGPKDVEADLPAQLYSAYVDASMKPQFTPQFGADVNVRTGVYSDFNTITRHSIRITGRGLGVVQLTPTLALKAGVEYLDRARIKLLPAGGFLWEPDPQTRWDIYFPRPKYSRYLSAWGNADVWWHLGAEYGGGSWTIDRVDAPMMDFSERIDINDIRVFLGIDWDRVNAFDGLFQVGYVFDREIVFTEVPSETTGLDDTFMVRLGLQF